MENKEKKKNALIMVTVLTV